MKSVMFIEATKLIGLPVAARDIQAKVGTVREIVVEPENGQILGFLVQIGRFLAKKALAVADIVDWDPKGLVTESAENLVEPSEIVRIKKVLDRKISLLGLKAKTESGIGLGKIENFLIDTETQSVVKYYLKNLLGRSRILSSDKVSHIEPKAIIFTDDVLEPPKGAVGAEA